MDKIKELTDLVEEIWCAGYRECQENTKTGRAGICPIKARDALVQRICRLFEQPTRILGTILPFQKRPDLILADGAIEIPEQPKPQSADPHTYDERSYEEGYKCGREDEAEAIKYQLSQDADLRDILCHLCNSCHKKDLPWARQDCHALEEAKAAIEAAGYRRCPKELWPVLTDEEILAAEANMALKSLVSKTKSEIRLLKKRAIAQVQRDACYQACHPEEEK